MRIPQSILVMALVLLMLPAATHVHALGGPLLTAVKGSSVIVDGVINATEWSDAQHFAFNWAWSNSSLASPADLWLKDNGTNLLVAVAANGTIQFTNATDWYGYTIYLLFNDRNNGLVENNDDMKSFWIEYFPSGGRGWSYRDEHYNAAMNYYFSDTYQNGTQTGVFSNPGGQGRWAWEFSIPMISAYPDDFTLPVNGTIGFELMYEQTHKTPSYTILSTGISCWPAGPPNCSVPRDYNDPTPEARGWATIIRSNGNTPLSDTTPPTIGTPTIQPASPNSNDQVRISVPVSDMFSGVKNVTVTYTVDNWVTNTILAGSVDGTISVASITIPAQNAGVHVAYYVTAYDYSGNMAVNSNGGSFFGYDVHSPPPGPPPGSDLLTSWLFLLAAGFIGALTLTGITLQRRRHWKARPPI